VEKRRKKGIEASHSLSSHFSRESLVIIPDGFENSANHGGLLVGTARFTVSSLILVPIGIAWALVNAAVTNPAFIGDPFTGEMKLINPKRKV
jgi:hypothetical protein